MVAFTGFRTPLILTAFAVALATGPALPQMGVQLIKVDLSVVAKGYRMSKLIGSSVINDKNEKVGTVDDVIAVLVIDDTGQKITLPGASKDELKKLSQFNYPAS